MICFLKRNFFVLYDLSEPFYGKYLHSEGTVCLRLVSYATSFSIPHRALVVVFLSLRGSETLATVVVDS